MFLDFIFRELGIYFPSIISRTYQMQRELSKEKRKKRKSKEKYCVKSILGERYKCKCCGYFTLQEEPLEPNLYPGTYEICPVCFWEDDSIQFIYPDYAGGANRVSLIEARKNFIEFGASEKEFTQNVRAPRDYELK